MQPLGPDDPRRIGSYRLLRQLGAGGMGQVYLGRTAGGRTVAVKTVRAELARDERFRARFRQEVAAARRVGGTWTAPVLDADTEGPQPWVATGYVAGPSLTTAVQQHGPLPEPTVRLLGVGLAEALAHVHALGLVHRDVKPSNVLLTLDGPRLIDFGIARALDADGGLTRTGHVIGSPGYMSPEQAQGNTAGPGSDVFSLGAVLALAATGRAPFGEDLAGAVLLYRVLHEEPDLPGLDGPLRAIVLQCLAKNPAHRPTPQHLRALLDPDGAAGARLGRSSWLPADLSAAVGRAAVRLLDLESDPTGVAGRAVPASAAPAAPPAPPAAPPAPPAPAPVPSSALAGHYAQTVTAPPPAPYGPTGAFGPPVAPAPAPAPERRGRGARIAVFVAAAVVATSLTGYGLSRLGTDDDPPSSSSSTTTSQQPAGAAPAAAVPSSAPTSDSASDTVPAAFLGRWQGSRAGSDGTTATLTVTVSQTRIGDQNAAQVSIDAPAGYCHSAWTLSAVTQVQLRFASRIVGSSGMTCVSGGERILDLQKDGTLRYTAMESGTLPLVLHRAT